MINFKGLFGEITGKNNLNIDDSEENEKSDKLKSNDEIVAVLTAAVAVCLNTSEIKFRIKSFRRIEDNMPVWNRAGRYNQILNNKLGR